MKQHLALVAIAFLLTQQASAQEPTVDERVQPPPSESARPEATYDAVWIEGKRFLIGRAGNLEVWFHLTDGPDLEAVVMVVNSSAVPITFDPAGMISAAAEVKSRNGVTADVGLHTFSADEYEANSQAKADFRRLGAALAQGFGAAGRRLNPGLTEGDRMVGDALAKQESREDAAAIRDRLELETAGLMRTHTVFPGSAHAGRVYFQRRKAALWKFDVLFGNVVFKFHYTPSR